MRVGTGSPRTSPEYKRSIPCGAMLDLLAERGKKKELET